MKSGLKLSSLLVLLILVGGFGFETANASVKIDEVDGSESLDELNVKIDGEEVTNNSKDNNKDKVIQSSDEECAFDLPQNKTYNAQVISVRRQLRVKKDENFRVKVFMKNTGTMTWFSNKSDCLGPKVSLGADKERDHDSAFYDEELAGWEGANRVGMDQLRVNPNEIASFTFWAKAGDEDEVYKEFFTPVVKDIQWIDSAGVSIDVIVGNINEKASDIRQKMSFSNFSGPVSQIDLNAEKSFHIDLSEQKLTVKLGDNVVREFKVSTGARATPTPTGEYEIMMKQYVRVGNAKPHYTMPRFMMFKAGGYGFHALPSLANDGGVFWNEAVSHIGTAVSHGCIRLLPADADWVYAYANVGTKAYIQG
ncbi:MAG: L,D-transpeptidase [Patescibacteria group bacterium]